MVITEELSYMQDIPHNKPYKEEDNIGQNKSSILYYTRQFSFKITCRK